MHRLLLDDRVGADASEAKRRVLDHAHELAVPQAGEKAEQRLNTISEAVVVNGELHKAETELDRQVTGLAFAEKRTIRLVFPGARLARQHPPFGLAIHLQRATAGRCFCLRIPQRLHILLDHLVDERILGSTRVQLA